MSEQQILDSEVTYTVTDMSLAAVKREGRIRWQAGHHNRIEWAMVPLSMLILLVVFVLYSSMKLSLLWLWLMAIPYGYGFWTTLDQNKKRKKAGEDFLNSPSVRRNG